MEPTSEHFLVYSDEMYPLLKVLSRAKDSDIIESLDDDELSAFEALFEGYQEWVLEYGGM